MAAVTTMTSPINAQTTAKAINHWLTNVKQGEQNDDDAESRGESDYENCQAMQQQIRIAVKNCNHIFTSNNTTTGEIVADCYVSSEESNDDDYATSGSLGDNSSSSSSLDTNLELTDREISCDGSKLYCKENQRKEITLKVVIDENETDKSGEEVFYINPLVSFFICLIYLITLIIVQFDKNTSSAN